MCEMQALREALQFSGRGHAPFAEALVNASLVSRLGALARRERALQPAVPHRRHVRSRPERAQRDRLRVPDRARSRADEPLRSDSSPSRCRAWCRPKCWRSSRPRRTSTSCRSWAPCRRTGVGSSALCSPSSPPRCREPQAPEIAQEEGEWGNIFDQADAAVLLDLKPLPNDNSGSRARACARAVELSRPPVSAPAARRIAAVDGTHGAARGSGRRFDLALDRELRVRLRERATRRSFSSGSMLHVE